ncbi:uncharacterized protein [Apostichopus japonicus]|uniref:uncharacterized protein n=1 Tax=Stichopus japonicus TaxID=307972 RepID=UPI003AB53DB6
MAVGYLRKFIVIIYISSILVGLGTNETCRSPQYLEIGKSGIILCHFPDGFSSVHWYNTLNIIDDDPTLNYEGGSIKSGSGYDSGEFDIQFDGSLLINNVTLNHETIFTVTKFTDNEDSPRIYAVDVHTFVKPQTPCPVIDQCSCGSEICYVQWTLEREFICEVMQARPGIPLTWMRWTQEGHRNVSFRTSVEKSTLTQTTSVTVTSEFDHSQLITLVCKAEDALHLLEKNESIILIHRKDEEILDEVVFVSFEQYSKLTLNCSYTDVRVLVWEKKHIDGSLETLAVIHGLNNFSKIFDDSLSLNEEGALVVSKVDIHHEGTYRCTFIDDNKEAVKSYKVAVYVNPVPPYPIIDGCDHVQYCVLTSGIKGSLTCSVKGIRPQIQLQWRAFRDEEKELISFSNQRSTAKINGDTSDIELTTDYETSPGRDKRITVECYAVGENVELFQLSTKVELLLPFDSNTTQETPLKDTSLSPAVYGPIVAGGVLSIIVIIPVLIILCKKSGTTPKPMNDEELKMLQNHSETEQTQKKRQFIWELQQSYELLYSSVQPVPYQKENSYNVNDLFVEGGIECLRSNPLSKKEERKWQHVKSYHEILNGQRSKSNRCIIEAEPGTGKTTLVLQMTYEWCVCNSGSLIGNVEILIFIKLIQLKGVSSFYEAIKRFILPRDSHFEANDIKDILDGVASVLIILDGFDEYPDHNNSRSDFSAILQKQMFPQFQVILTTRTGCLPKHFAPRTKRIRLTGFNAEAQDQYLKKAVTMEDENAAKTVKEFLLDNPVLADLCQFPLFFVLYAHLSQENQSLKECTSVTTFFRYVVSCFHRHYTRKLPDNPADHDTSFEKDHDELNKIAFESLCRDKRRTEWRREELENRLGEDFVEYYLLVGILRETELTETVDLPGTAAADHIQTIHNIRFYHSLFCEWYAANNLTDVIKSGNGHSDNDDDTLAEEKFEFLEDLDLSNFHYVYRFACGLDPQVAKQLIEYIKATDGGDKYATLCILERNGSVEHIKDMIQNLCSRTVHIAHEDSRLIQRSIQQLLDIVYAMKPQIKVTKLLLHESFRGIDVDKCEIIVTSGLKLSCQNTIETLWIEESENDLGENEFKDLLKYSLQCPSLKNVSLSASVVPSALGDEALLKQLIQKKVTVNWYPSVVWYFLNLQEDCWQVSNGISQITDDEYLKEVTRIREIKKNPAISEVNISNS